jgi:phosphoribosyl-ATP pyrophosphohydrolase
MDDCGEAFSLREKNCLTLRARSTILHRLRLSAARPKLFPDHCCTRIHRWEGNYPVTTEPQPLDKLERTIAARAANPNEKSYTSQLLAGGVEKIGAKIVEEASEVVEAAGEPGPAGREHFIREVGDLVYHLMVLMRQQNCTLTDLEAELSRRFGVSGLDEKAARKK